MDGVPPGEVFVFVVGFSRARFLSFRKPNLLPRRVDVLVSQGRNQNSGVYSKTHVPFGSSTDSDITRACNGDMKPR